MEVMNIGIIGEIIYQWTGVGTKRDDLYENIRNVPVRLLIRRMKKFTRLLLSSGTSSSYYSFWDVVVFFFIILCSLTEIYLPPNT